MTDRNYVAWSLLAAGGFALMLAVFGRFRAANLKPPYARKRARLSTKLDDQEALGHGMEAGRLSDAIDRLDAFAARHPRIGTILTVIDRANMVAIIFMVAFVGVGFWAGRVGSHPGQWPLFATYFPLLAIGWIVESIPPVDGEARGMLVACGLMTAFAIPLMLAHWATP